MKSENEIPVEHHYTVFEIAEKMSVSHMTVRRWFENEPDVIIFGSDETRYGRKRKTMRIPVSVALRVINRMKANGCTQNCTQTALNG